MPRPTATVHGNKDDGDRRQPRGELYYNDLRVAGAQVRKFLVAAAAEKWDVDAATLRTEPGFVVNPANGRSSSYGEIASFGKVPSPLPAVDAKELKPQKDFRLIGKSVARRDIPAKVDGSARIRIDVHAARHGLRDVAPFAGANRRAGELERRRHQKMPGVIATVKLRTASRWSPTTSSRRWPRSTRSRSNWQKGKAAGFDSSQALEKDYEKSITIRMRRPRPCRRRAM